MTIRLEHLTLHCLLSSLFALQLIRSHYLVDRSLIGGPRIVWCRHYSSRPSQEWTAELDRTAAAADGSKDAADAAAATASASAADAGKSAKSNKGKPSSAAVATSSASASAATESQREAFSAFCQNAVQMMLQIQIPASRDAQPGALMGFLNNYGDMASFFYWSQSIRSLTRLAHLFYPIQFVLVVYH